jgi:DNA repair protein SbcC/Rad50
MQLRRLDVANVRSYETGHVEFPPGTTLIVGDVGAGKTSLLYAIEMALFGTAEVDAAYLVRHGAHHAEVAVRFEDEHHRYDLARRFRRIRRKGRDTFETERITFREDGAPTAYSATELRQRVIELLGFADNPNPQARSDLWRWAVYVPQERMREILSARPQDRLETVRKALGVERYRTAAENAQELAGDLRSTAQHRREEAGRMVHFDLEHEEALRDADRLRAERAALEDSAGRRQREVEAQTARVEAQEEVVRRAEADERERSSLTREQEADDRNLRDLKHRAKERGDEQRQREAERDRAAAEAAGLGEARSRLEEAERSLTEARAAIDRQEELLRRLASAEAELDAAERVRAELGSRRTALGHALDEVRTELERASTEGPSREPVAPTERTIPELDHALDAAREAERKALEQVVGARNALAELEELLRAGVCPRCRQPVSPAEFGPHRDEAAEGLAAAEERRAQAATDREALEAERKARERFERTHDRWTELERRRGTLRTDLARREAERSELAGREEEARAALEGVRRRAAELRPQAAASRSLREAVSEGERLVADRRRAVDRAALSAERARAADVALATLRAEAERAERDRSGLETRRAQRSARLAELGGRTEGAAEGRRALEAERAELARLEEALAGERAALVRTETRLDAEVRRAATAEQGRAERSGLLAEADALGDRAEWLSGPFRVHVLTMEQELLAHAQTAFDRAFSRYFAALVDDPALVAGTDASFTPEVTLDGESTPAEALSGGERTGLALAFRLALASVVRSLGSVRLDTILLDEPTDGFSAEQVVRMGELLDELALPQVIVVSHESELASIADHTLRVVKEGGVTRIEGEAKAEGEAPAEATPPPRTRRARRPRLPD